ncbi:MAG: glycosyltransferase WbuB [Bacteroidetes bacterium]|nr:MAG: glycosyltransferase WbuB [Bacteroidota bacterium]
MRILFVSNYFPPEVNAPATRTFEHAREWVRLGHEVEVLTSNPNFPEGRIYDGYTNGFATETVEGIKVTRVPMYVTANKGTVKRTLSYLSYMASVRLYLRRLQQQPDIVVATSPQFFAAVAGHLIARKLRVPFVMEVRDLWPESVVAVGASSDNAVIRACERLETYLYEQADHIVVVTRAFKRHIENRGIPSAKISVLPNGADLAAWDRPLDEAKLAALRAQHGLQGKFVAGYIGTIGMAHRADILWEAARRCDDPDIVFMVVGTGAEREKLEALQAANPLPNFRLLDKVPKEEVPYLLALTDASVVHLRDLPLFRTVIPSKIFEAMATRTPIILGVEGESKEIVQEADAGLTIPPENVEALLGAVTCLKNDPDLYEQLGTSGRRYVETHYNRTHLARAYADVLADVLGVETPLPEVRRDTADTGFFLEAAA